MNDEQSQPSSWRSFMELIKFVGIALIIAFVVRTFIIHPYFIPSGSMRNTLLEGDRIFVCKFSYGLHIPFVSKEVVSFGEPQHGDIIVFPFPKNPSVDYIKRVVGVPGDVIEIRNKQLYRNNEPVHEDYVIHISPSIVPGLRDNMAPRTVPEGKVFVMGDNRDASEDSRFWNFVDKDTIHGKALLIFWSSTDWVNIAWSRIGTVLH